LLAGVYFVTAKWGLSLGPESGFATYVWPPTGIALAVLLLTRKEYWPGVFIGAFLANYSAGARPLVAVGIAAGNTLEAVTAVYLLRRFKFRSSLEHVQDVAMLVGIAALFSTLIAATVGTTTLWVGSQLAHRAYASTWATWWLGDMLSNLILLPFLLAFLRQPLPHPNLKRAAEGTVLIAAFLAANLIIFEAGPRSITELAGSPYLLFPLLIWATVRFQLRIVTLLMLILGASTVAAAHSGYGPFIGQSIHDSLFASQLFIGLTTATFLTFSASVSESRKSQKAEQELNFALQKSLNAAAAELREEQKIEKLRDDFVATASHELRTPITSIKAYAQILERELTAEGKKRSRLAANINRQADKLTRLVGDLLDVRNTRQGTFELHKAKFDLDELLDRIVHDFRVSYPGRNIVRRGSVKYVFADKHRLEQVIVNLLTNAAKYSDASSTIRLETKSAGKQFTLSVHDHGPGISKTDVANIFKRFYRTADTNQQKQGVSGMGLGLYISQEIIQQHGGKITVTTKVGKGSTFSFTLPMNEV
jgi:signal transduction histidine kinase